MSEANHNRRPLLVVGIGESLFDCFPDRVMLGGAPMNVAVHANRMLAPLGGRAVAATRLGTDKLAQNYLDGLVERGLDVSVVQIDHEHPTGTVTVDTNSSAEVSYTFAADVAWDHLEFTDEWKQLAGRCDAVAFGTLAQRSPRSRAAIVDFLAAAQHAIRLFDVNLRGNFYSPDVIEQSLRLASTVKLNEEELPLVCDLLGLCISRESSADEQATLLRTTFDLNWVALTRGARGTVLYNKAGRHEGTPASVAMAPDADSVGAGDACSAALLVADMIGLPTQSMVQLANRAGAFVASQPGATPELPVELMNAIGYH